MVDQLPSSEERLSRASLVPVFGVSMYTQTGSLVDRLSIPPWEERLPYEAGMCFTPASLRVEPSGRLARPCVAQPVAGGQTEASLSALDWG